MRQTPPSPRPFQRPFPLVRLLRWSLLALPLACNSPAVSETLKPSAPPATGDVAASGDGVDPKKVVGYLASDELEGRGIGTAGIDKAADYIAGAFKRLGLQPAPALNGDYFQSFGITAATAPDPATTLASGDKTYKLGDDFSVVSFSGEAKFDAPVVFVGYGITSEEHKYDDYAGLDVKGKVVLALRYEPHDVHGVSRFTKAKDEWSREAALISKAKNATKHGAAALLLVNPPKYHEDTPMPFSRELLSEKAAVPFLHVKRHVADELLKRARGKDVAALQDEIDAAGKPLAMPLPNVTASGDVKILRTETKVKNVVGVLPGKGPLAGEFVVIGAHYDHLGLGGAGSLRPMAKEIHNGADDNASGTSAMLELAEHYAKNGGSADGRSIVFAAFTAEESGLIGSERFVNHPPVPLDKIAYMVNFDMVGRVRNNVLSVGGTGTAASFEALLKKADEASPLELKTFGKGGYGPSDHMSFAMKKIPVLFFWSGTHPDYHKPSDDADKVNYEGIGQVVQLGATIVDALRTQPREQYVAASDHSGMSPGGRGGSRVSLGVVPDYGTDEIKGVKISGTVPDSPAEKAGLKDGDVLIQFGSTKIDSLYGLTDALRAAKPGDKVKLTVLRDGKEVETEATLAERKG
jgi:hypothetical protein